MRSSSACSLSAIRRGKTAAPPFANRPRRDRHGGSCGVYLLVIPSALPASDILLDAAQPQHQSTRLKVVSVLRLHKIGTVHTTSLRRYIGSLSPLLQQEVDTKLRMVLKL